MAVMVIILHSIVCVLAGIGFWKQKFRAKPYLFPAVVFVPFWGLLLFGLEEAHERGKGRQLAEIGVDNLKIQDVKYRPIEMDERKDEEITVPLEEAMAVNEAPVTRRLMMDILHKNPAQYIELLQAARSTDDTELAHYATTTMLEVQSSYEKEISHCMEELRRNPKDKTLLRKCRKELAEYIESGLLSGGILDTYRIRLDEILRRLCREEPDNRKYITHWIENKIALGQYEGLETHIKDLIARFPEDERVYQAAVDYYWHMGQGNEIQNILDYMDRKNIYLTSMGKKWYKFWKQDS